MIVKTRAMSPTAVVAGSSRQYDAFGNVLSSTGTFTGTFGYGGVFGYQEDASGLKLLGHRYYDSGAGRFLSRDPARDGRNWYAYCDNDPLRNTDPNGQFVAVLPALEVLAVAGLAIITVGTIQNAPPEVQNDLGRGLIGVGPTLVIDLIDEYRKNKPGASGAPHYPVGPHVDMDPDNVHGGPHTDFPDPVTGKNERIPLGPPGWNPQRDPETGKMKGIPGGSNYALY